LPFSNKGSIFIKRFGAVMAFDRQKKFFEMMQAGLDGNP